MREYSKFKDISGLKFGKLTAISDTGKKGRNGHLWLFRCDCGVEKIIPRGRVVSHIRSCGNCLTRDDLTGKKFGKLTVIEINPINHSNGRGSGKNCLNGSRTYKCLCECGKEIDVPSVDLRRGGRVSCGCSSGEKRRNKKKIKNSKDKIVKEFYFQHIKSMAVRRHEFLLTHEYLDNLAKIQENKCALSGIKLIFPKIYKERKDGISNTSLDRIDSSKGYIEGNVQWVHKHINMMKQQFSQSDFIYFCKEVAKNARD